MPPLAGLIAFSMKRYTAMRTSLIASAVAWPLGAMIFYLTLVYALPGIYYWLIISSVLCLVPLSVALCMDPAAENIEARPRLGKGSSMTFIRVIGFISWLIFWLIFWLIRQPEVKSWLRDWKPTTVVVLLCLQIMRLSLRKALAFKVTDLYPHLRRVEKTESR